MASLWRGGWGAEWLSYKNIEMKPFIDSTDFILYNKDNSGLKEYGFNGVETVSQKVSEGKRLNLAGIMFVCWRPAYQSPKSLLKAISTELIK